MDYYLLWSLLAGLLGGLLPYAGLSRLVRSLRLDLATFENKFLSEQKRKAAQMRWNAEASLEEFKGVPQAQVVPKKSPLLKFGIGGKA